MLATELPRRLAPGLNAACQCIWLDHAALRAHLERSLGADAPLLEERPGLASGSVVFLDPQDAVCMDRTTQLVGQALASPAYQRHIEEHAPGIATAGPDTTGTTLGLDFHLGGPAPQLIEVNTNPGGLLVNLELARAVTAACECMAEPLAGLASGHVPLAELPSRIVASFRSEHAAQQPGAPLRRVAIVDDEPANQYLYAEFVLYRRLFEAAGWEAGIFDSDTLEYRDGILRAGGERIDLVYNRLTDFYLADARHAALRAALESSAATITPHPAAHAHWADKRLLAWLHDERLLADAGLDAEDRAHLLRTIPPTEIVEPAAADDLWRRRKTLFFKPVDGYGSKAAYAGGKLTRATFGRILAGRYVAQAFAPTSSRRIVVSGTEADLRVDIRNFVHRNVTWLRAARLYRGQTTNFRTSGGGFAPVLTLRP
jgi:hypothetical protein